MKKYKIYFESGLAWCQSMEVESENIEHADLLQLIDGYFEKCRDEGKEHNFIALTAEEAEEIEGSVPINGGEFYIHPISHIEEIEEQEFEINVNFDGTICVTATSVEEALDIVKQMSCTEIVKKASGSWAIEKLDY